MGTVELVIDVGSKVTTIFKKDVGLIIQEPSVVAINNKHNKMALLESGKNAQRLMNTSRRYDFQVLFPIKEGSIFHERAAVLMYRDFINRAVGSSIISPKVKVIACVSCGLNNMEKKDVEKTLLKAGASEVLIIESPLAVAQGLSGQNSSFIMDIGGSKTEIAIIDRNGIVAGFSINIGGDSINQAIIDYVIDTRRCKIKPSSAEKVKRQIASMYDNDNSPMIVNTEALHGDENVSVRLVASELKQAICPVIDKIIEVAYNYTFQIPECIAQEIYENGITLCGGSAYIPGLADYISAQLQLKVRVPDMPENAAALGASHFFNDKASLARLLNVKGLDG